MYYTPQIYDPEQGFAQIISAASKFNHERFLYALTYKNWDEKQFELMAKEVATYREKLEAEYERLVEFAKIFNKEFATMNNQCYSSALALLKKLRSGISETKRIFTKFCPRAHRDKFNRAAADKPVSAYDYALISAETYQLSLFDFEGYPPCISSLCDEMQKFFLLLIRCMQLCQQVLKDEQEIKRNNKYCKYLFEQFKEKVMCEIYDILMMIPRDSAYLSEENNSAIASRINYDNDEAWAPVGFHNHTKTEVKHLIIKQVLEAEEGSDITRIERLLFGDDEAKVHKIRHIIKHFDELIPDDYKRKKLSAKHIQMYFQFVGIPSGLESEAVDYFNETYLSSESHKFTTVTYSAVNNHKKEVLEDKKEEYKKFVEKINQRFYKVYPLQMAANS